MPTKAYFIGLGGCGLKTVADLQQRLCPTGDFSEYQFTYVDTDDATINKINAEKTIIRNVDRINVGDTNPRKVYDTAKGGHSEREKRFMEWVISQDQGAKFELPNQRLSDGARARRMIGRTAVHHRYDDIYRELKGKIGTFDKYDPHNPNNVPQIWVVASSCGGTGSSMTLDVLYMLDKIVNESHQSSPELKLVLFMPKPFMEVNDGNVDYTLNAFSYMWELNAFRLDYQNNLPERYHNFSPDADESTGIPFPLYKFIIPVDVETSFGAKIPLESLYPTVAELIYYCNKGKAALDMMSNISNDQNQLRELTSNANSFCSWTRTLVPYGYRAIKKANVEFRKYLYTRAMYEVLKYGVLGNEMPENPEIREKAKVEFAKEYILKYLCDLPEVGVVANENSLQAEVAEELALAKVNPATLDKPKMSFMINKIDEQGALEFKPKSFAKIKEAINAGVQKSIIEHGLKYTKDVLNLVDDFYLETVALTALKAQRDTVMASKAAKKSECDAACAGFKEKNASAAARLLNEYMELTQQYYVLDKAINFVEFELTAYPGGYLEVLRKGDSRHNGLQNIINKIETASASAYDAYQSLAQAFLETDKDALTQYLPNLSAIATGKNSTYWADNSLFDRMYHESIIAYDIVHEQATGKRIPVRKNQGENNLSRFLECVSSGNTSLTQLALHDDTFRFNTNLNEWILEPIQKEIEAAVNKDGTEATKWLNLNLEESLKFDGMLPKDQTLASFLNAMSDKDKIPVLYPTHDGATRPSQTRLMFAGASSTMAEMMGYNQADKSHQFVQDNSMADRFLIIKMPLGSDFYSYKYFQAIKDTYMSKVPEILAEEHGCHSHKHFSLLDLDKATAKVELPRYSYYVHTLFSAAYYQAFLDTLQATSKDVYDRFCGEFVFNPTVAQPVAPTTGGFNFGLGAAPASAGANLSAFSQKNDKYLLKMAFNQQNFSFTFTVQKLVLENNRLKLGWDAPKSKMVTRIQSLKEFMTDFVSTTGTGPDAVSGKYCIDCLAESVAMLNGLINSQDEFKQAFASLRPAVGQAAMATPLFQLALQLMQMNNPSDAPYFDILDNILNG